MVYNANGIVPIGGILPYGGSAERLPKGYLLCDGSCYRVGDYFHLFKVINHFFDEQEFEYVGDLKNGQDDPRMDSYFAVPDCRGRFLKGAGEIEDYPSQVSECVQHQGSSGRITLTKNSIKGDSKGLITQLSPNSFELTVPSDVTKMKVTLVGGGGGSAGGVGTTILGSGGGGGGLSISNIPVVPNEKLTVEIGVGGIGGVYNGFNGGSSIIFRAGLPMLNAGGGMKGVSSPSCAAGGAGGTGITDAGKSGGYTSFIDCPDQTTVGRGGNSGGNLGLGGSINENGHFPGGGGGTNTIGSSRTGYSGADGVAIIEWGNITSKTGSGIIHLYRDSFEEISEANSINQISTGVYQMTVPNDINELIVRGWGAGGGGGGGGQSYVFSQSGGGGGAGAYTFGRVPVTPGSVLYIEIGKGGLGSSSSGGAGNAENGGDTFIIYDSVPIFSSQGGLSGENNRQFDFLNFRPGLGGAGGSNNVGGNLSFIPGGNGANGTSEFGFNAWGGQGGSSPKGGTGGQGGSGGFAGIGHVPSTFGNAPGGGGGGGGGGAFFFPGGHGADGFLEITWGGEICELGNMSGASENFITIDQMPSHSHKGCIGPGSSKIGNPLGTGRSSEYANGFTPFAGGRSEVQQSIQMTPPCVAINYIIRAF